MLSCSVRVASHYLFALTSPGQLPPVLQVLVVLLSYMFCVIVYSELICKKSPFLSVHLSYICDPLV